MVTMEIPPVYRRKCLLLGAGSSRKKILGLTGDTGDFSNDDLTTLDMVAAHKPDVIHDLNRRPLPFNDNTFDEIHAYEVLEHIGRQGDWEEFFQEFAEYWRILKTDGVLLATVPLWSSMSAWGDPSHTRVISNMTLSFLSQEVYARDIGKTVMSDFRGIWKKNFAVVFADDTEGNFCFGLQKRPS